MDYTALQAYVVSQLHRTSASMDTMVPTFIELARLRIGRDVRALANLKTTTISSWSSEAASLPTDLSRLRTVSNDGQQLAPNSSNDLGYGQVLTYSIRGQQIVVPGVGASTPILLEYWAIPAALSGGTDVSYGMAEWPQVWVQAALIEADVWQRDYEHMQVLLGLYTAEVEGLNQACTQSLYGNAPATITDQPMLQSGGWL